MGATYDKLAEILETYNLGDDEISEATRFKKMEIDEFDEDDIRDQVEDEFGIDLEGKKFKSLKTVGNLVAFIDELCEKVAEKNLVTPEEVAAVDWLIASNDEYGGSPLAKWDGRHGSKPLGQFAVLRRAFPDYLQKASDYLFAASTTAFEEEIQSIARSEIEGRRINRRASMLGGFPWTDDNNPWPHSKRDDGGITWAYPAIQLNLAELSSKLEIKLPSIILQIWDGLEPIEIPLDQIDHKESDWNYPNYHEIESAFGWDHTDTDVVGGYVDVGRPSFQIPSLVWALDHEAAYRDEYESQSIEDKDWKDLPEWEELRKMPDSEIDRFDQLTDEAYNAYTDMDSETHAFFGIPERLDVSLRINLHKQGYRVLYNARSKALSGLNLWMDGYLSIYYRENSDGSFNFKLITGR